ncbi:hypothetical protein [Neorhodopirellula lusitana]|uniref:hypothetical protein n=1 Tax=Neorhodopirellula lusitana TaxID=445327 RepID=UPI003850F143
MLRCSVPKTPIGSLRRKAKSRRKHVVQRLDGRFLLTSDLIPAQFLGWDDSFVIATQTGTNTNATAVPVSDDVFVDLGWTNVGSTTVSANTFTTRLELDGYTVGDFSTPFELAQFGGAAFEDLGLGQLTLGSHTLRLIVDVADDVVESDENYNVREKRFFGDFSG